MQSLIHIAGGRGSRKKRVRQAAQVTGLSASRINTCWYADPRVAVRLEELQAARTAALEVLRHEHRRAEELLSQLEALQDEEFHSEQVDALRRMALC
jgi:hypothetical protein